MGPPERRRGVEKRYKPSTKSWHTVPTPSSGRTQEYSASSSGIRSLIVSACLVSSTLISNRSVGTISISSCSHCDWTSGWDTSHSSSTVAPSLASSCVGSCLTISTGASENIHTMQGLVQGKGGATGSGGEHHIASASSPFHHQRD